MCSSIVTGGENLEEQEGDINATTEMNLLS